MYVVIEVGGKQYQVKKSDFIDVEKQEAQVGKEITLVNVLLLFKDNKLEVGQPYLKDVKVKAEVVRPVKADKAVIFKYRRRKSSHTKKGHRQQLTRLKIKDIVVG